MRIVLLKGADMDFHAESESMIETKCMSTDMIRLLTTAIQLLIPFYHLVYPLCFYHLTHNIAIQIKYIFVILTEKLYKLYN